MPVSGSGTRDRKVTVQQLSTSKGSSGAPVDTWTDLRTDVWASKRDVSGRERFVQNQTSAPYDSHFELPFSDDWNPDVIDVPKTRRLVYEGRVYDIVAAMQIGRKRGVAVDTLSGGLVS